ncbi:MAG: hypothetical protein QM484_07540 [Woeseiaceae bacterium]
MSNYLTIYINDEKLLEHDKNTRHPGKQRQFFETMDLDMDEGIELNGNVIKPPNKEQRSHYIIMRLLYGIENKSEGLISSTCGYLITRYPELKQIRAINNGKDVSLDLIFNEMN